MSLNGCCWLTVFSPPLPMVNQSINTNELVTDDDEFKVLDIEHRDVNHRNIGDDVNHRETGVTRGNLRNNVRVLYCVLLGETAHRGDRTILNKFKVPCFRYRCMSYITSSTLSYIPCFSFPSTTHYQVNIILPLLPHHIMPLATSTSFGCSLGRRRHDS